MKQKWLWVNFTCCAANLSDNNGEAKQDNRQNGNGFVQTIALSLAFLTDSSLGLCSSSILVITDTEVVPAAQSGYTGSPAPPGWNIHICSHKKVCCVSQQSLKIMEEIPGHRLLHEESWTEP